jgi:phosphinothricin acetyltransferase
MMLTIRTATVDDAKDILNIYAYYVEKTAITFEYEVPSLEEFKGRIQKTLETYPYLVEELDGRIIGYAYAGPLKQRAAYDWCCEMTIYLDHLERGHGAGKKLYFALEEALKKMGILNFYACIGYPVVNDEYLTQNSASFHAHLGYKQIGYFTKCGYKFNRWYDMVWMEKMAGEHRENTPPIKKYRDLVKN